MRTMELNNSAMQRMGLIFAACILAACAISCLGVQKAYAGFRYVSYANQYIKISPATNSGLALDISGESTSNYANAMLYSKGNGHPNQVFYLQYRKTWAGKKFYSLRAVHSGKYLDVCGGYGSRGINLQQYTYNGTDAQLFCFCLNDAGYVIIQSKLGTVVDMAGGVIKSGTNVHMWDYNNTNAQRWKLYKWYYDEKPTVYAYKSQTHTVTSRYQAKYVARVANASDVRAYRSNSRISVLHSYQGSNCYNYYVKGISNGTSILTLNAYNKTWGWRQGKIYLNVKLGSLFSGWF